LEDEEKLTKLCKKNEDNVEFTSALFHYFDAHEKSEQLLTWAFRREVLQIGEK
jgi:hypothetical protein